MTPAPGGSGAGSRCTLVGTFVGRVPGPLALEAWLTWYYKNNPSVIRGWRSAQMTCLHLRREDGVMHPEAFLNEAQLAKKAAGKLRYLPGPPSVIESALLVGFIGRREQTGHPSQKPEAVYDPLVRMATLEGDLLTLYPTEFQQMGRRWLVWRKLSGSA